ncbi:3-hydroxy-3-methylglutaryl-coenzyme A (HMG-CoA) reductase isozyme, partial [Ascosphaera atra]
MRGSTLLPRYIRDLISTSPSSTAQATNGDDSEPPKPAPSWLNRKVTRVLCAASHRVCLHPIHTIVVIALLASTTYIGLLEGSLVDSVRLARPGTVNVDGLLEGGRSLRVGPETGWKWVSEDIVGGGASEGGGGAGDEGVDYVQVEGSWNDDVEVAAAAVEKHKAARHLALTTFIFPHHSSNKGASISTESVRLPANVSVESIPATPNLFAPISQDSSLAFAVPYDQVTDFLRAAQEIPQKDGGEKEGEQKKWIMKAARSSTYGSRRALRIWAVDAYSSFVDLIMHAETIDIIIMSLGYLSMNLTIVSLFSSMRRLGSKFWLAATVLFKGMIAFLFALLVTTKLGVPISLKLLSEGVPFLVVTIGFEKPIILTKAVLSANVEHLLHHGAGDGPKNSASTNEKNGPNSGSAKPSATGSSRRRPNPIQGAIQTAIQEKGFKIFLDYVIEIGVLVAGALSDVQGGLRQFCFLASWILFFDGIMLFTFYTTILCIKLEINRIKRHVALRRALEEEGVTHRVAENVAAINDNAWPPSDTESGTSSNSSNAGSKGASKGKSGGRFKRSSVLGIFGKTIKASSVPKFKALMIGGFV